MLDKIAEGLIGITSIIPAVFVEEGSPHFLLYRVLAALLLLAFIVYVIAMCPFGGLLTRIAARLRGRSLR